MIELSSVLAILEISAIVIPCVVAAWKWVWAPYQKRRKKEKQDIVDLTKKITDVIGAVNDNILPIVNNLGKEFAKNGGKSVLDRINRIDERVCFIDDSVRLGELRSKLLASNLISTGMFECAADGNLVWANSTFLTMFGLTEEEVKGNGWLTAVCEDERTEVWERWNEQTRNSIPYEHVYCVCNKITNERFKIRSSALCHKNKEGKILGYFGTIIRLN